MGEEKEHGLTYVSPALRTYNEYFDHLVAFNRAIHREINSDLSKVCKAIEGAVIATAGSDARLEKGPVSLVEFVIFGDSFFSLESAARDLRRYALPKGKVSLYDPEIELKNVKTERMAYLVLNKGTADEVRLVSPNRVFDSTSLCGDTEIFAKAQQQLVYELASEEGKSILEKIKDKTRQHRKTAISGIQRFGGNDLMHYDLETGTAFYDPNRKVWSFKQGPLRTLQYALVRDQIVALRAGKPHESIFALPKNTVEKLHAIEVEGLSELSHEQVSDLADSYKYFLWLYHKSQEQFRDEHKVNLSFDRVEVAKRAKDLAEICGSPIIRVN